MPQPLFPASFFSSLFTTGGYDIRALMVVCRYLGDVLLATPLAESLCRAGYRVDWVVAPGTESILEQQSCADQVFVTGPTSPLRQQLDTGRRLWRKYDLAFALPSNDRSMLLSLAASRTVHAMIPANRRQDAWKRHVSKVWADYTPGAHMVALACNLAEASHLPACRDVQIQWSEDDMQQVFASLPWAENTPFLHIHPFARWPYKWWRKAAWQQLIQAALDRDLKVVLTGSPTELDKAEEIVTNFPPSDVHIAAGTFNWRQLACLSKYAAAYIGMDTANTHLAAAAGANVVALFGPTDPRIWGPWPNGFAGSSPWQASSPDGIQRQGNISLLQGRQDCIPCQLEGCDKRQDSISLCLKEMQADWVWGEVEERIRLSDARQAENQ